MEDFIENTIKKHQERLIGRIEKELNDRLLELGIKVNWWREKNSRFKSISKETQGNKETFYYNDGSLDGRKILEVIYDNKIPSNENFSKENSLKISLIAQIKYF